MLLEIGHLSQPKTSCSTITPPSSRVRLVLTDQWHKSQRWHVICPKNGSHKSERQRQVYSKIVWWRVDIGAWQVQLRKGTSTSRWVVHRAWCNPEIWAESCEDQMTRWLVRTIQISISRLIQIRADLWILLENTRIKLSFLHLLSCLILWTRIERQKHRHSFLQ